MRVTAVCLLLFTVISLCDAAPAKPDPIPTEGSAIVVFARHLQSGDVQLAAQKVSRDGALLWAGGKGGLEVALEAGYLERAASVVRDGAGGVIVVFEAEARAGSAAGDCDLWAQRLDANGGLAWNDGSDPVAVANSGSDEMHPLAVPDGSGGVIVFYEKQEGGNRVVLLAQRVSGSGSRLWSGPTVVVPDADSSHAERLSAATSDGAGGAIVVYEVAYASGEYAGDSDLHAQRLSAEGKLLWSTDDVGPTLCSGEGLERGAALIPSEGGVIVAFEYEFREGEHAGDCDIFAQRLSAAGEMLWNDGDKSMMLSGSKHPERAVAVLPDGKGGIIAVFESEPREGEFTGDCELLAQRLDADGEMVWNDGECSSDVASSKWGEKGPVLVPDGKGGAIVVFEQHGPKEEFAGDIDIGAERISADGTCLWSTPESDQSVDVASRNDLLERSPAAVSDGAGGAIVIYEAEARIGKDAGRSDLLAQRLGPDGKLLWNEGKPLTIAGSEASETHPVMVVP